jgi:hypothetical protein
MFVRDSVGYTYRFEDTDTIVLTGSGAYDGLSAYLVMTWTRAGGSFREAIFPGGMPSAPGT